MANQVATKKNAELSTDIMDDILEFAGEGAAFGADEMQIPFVRALQALSPQLGKKKPEYIEGAEQGDMFNTVTGEVWKGDDGVTIIPCYQTTKYLEFTPRDQGGGFRGEINPTDPILQRTSRVGVPKGNPSDRQRVGQVRPALLLGIGWRRRVSACCYRHEVYAVKGQPSLEDPDCNAEDQEPENRGHGCTSAVRYSVEDHHC